MEALNGRPRPPDWHASDAVANAPRYAAHMSAPPSPATSLDQLRLPKAMENDPKGAAVHAALRAQARKLWEGSRLVVPTARWSRSVEKALEVAQREHRLVRGLEQIEKVLEREAHGQSMADARSATPRGSRVSRLMLVSNDGTERFYRQVERLVVEQSPRLLAILLDADSSQFAASVPEAAGVLRAIMVEHKELVASVLIALYEDALG
jgi:hypothetical protein